MEKLAIVYMLQKSHILTTFSFCKTTLTKAIFLTVIFDICTLNRVNY